MKKKRPIDSKCRLIIAEIVSVIAIVLSVFTPQIIDWWYTKEGLWFTKTTFSKQDLLSFYGSFLAFLGTVALGALALWQNHKFEKNNRLLAEKNAINESKPITTLQKLKIFNNVTISNLNDESNGILLSMEELPNKLDLASYFASGVTLSFVFADLSLNHATHVKIENAPEVNRFIYKTVEELKEGATIILDNSFTSINPKYDKNKKIYTIDNKYTLLSVVEDKLVMKVFLITSICKYENIENRIEKVFKNYILRSDVVNSLLQGKFSMRFLINFLNNANITEEYLLEFFINETFGDYNQGQNIVCNVNCSKMDIKNNSLHTVEKNNTIFDIEATTILEIKPNKE